MVKVDLTITAYESTCMHNEETYTCYPSTKIDHKIGLYFVMLKTNESIDKLLKEPEILQQSSLPSRASKNGR